jgi:hypothetical protein
MNVHYYPQQPKSGTRIEYKARGVRDFEVATFFLTSVDGEERPMLRPALTDWQNVIAWWPLDDEQD